MKKKSHFILLFITISLFSCKSAIKGDNTPISDMNTDFPTSEKLDFKHFNKYDLYGGGCFIDDSILWYFGNDKSSVGYCYDLNTGKKLSTIAMIGKASYEFIESPGFEFTDDSIQFYTLQNSIKTFAKKEIIENKPMSERKFSITTCPDTICAYRMFKLPNGYVLATIRPNIFGRDIKNEINKRSIVLFNDHGANSYGTINYDSFNVEQIEGKERPKSMTVNDQIKLAYCGGSIVTKESDMAAFSVNSQFILYTFDLNTKNVVKEKRYTKMQGLASQTVNDMYLRINDMKSNDKYIFCRVLGLFNKADTTIGEEIFVFDWDLNPVKRFKLPYEKGSNFVISSDCSSVYFCKDTEEGLIMQKADLNL